ncbi:uncharacterized protein N7482_003737 [Penicillium canariense]|uniref:Uncharacterized protein n=1 Tax=Penicillium canariense TaxID=189055 RepID=A0A9W9LPW4_9EURO|nr:uncharacterized protein N7482_003737 [Penicillium canariense]KAJ5168143.1 hypothetical protein N7482_003737 [Penicillium canariense]
MRVGSQVYCKGENDEYKLLPILRSENDYIEEMASNGYFVAVSTRRAISKTDIEFPESVAGPETVLDCAEIVMQERESVMRLLDEVATGNVAESTQPTTVASKSDIWARASVSSASSISLEDADDLDAEPWSQRDQALDAESDSEHTDELLYSSSDSVSSNTAYTSWSEASTESLSEEMEDDEQWNDWGNERITLEELQHEREELSSEADSSDSDDENAALLSDTEIKSNLSEEHNAQGFFGDQATLQEAYSDVESRYSPSEYSACSDSQEGSDNEERALFEELLLGNKTTKGEGTKRTNIRIYDPTRLTDEPIFHYTCFIKGGLFGSPPAFHPSKPLLVWPLGDGEILFANYDRKTYFTRELCRSQSRSCHIFIKTQFSRDGRHLHFAALEGSATEKKEGEPDSALLSLQVSTHRLSDSKTARSPPRLVFRTTVDLGRVTNIPVSNLPYFLTWTDDELFFTQRDRKLDIIRIPLFRSPDSTDANVCSLQDPIFLPRSVEARNMYFFPAREAPPKSGRKKDEKSATLILGSYCSLPTQGVVVPKHMHYPPIAASLRENQDLTWMCRAAFNETRSSQPVNSACGRLKGKFESFDREEDCDIVPYLY